jgi:peptidoglycan hydrolase-like protein with peptidoglycan-binding domain
MKNLFNNMDSSEKDRILEMHKKKGYGTINEQPSAAGGFDITRFNQPGGKPTDANSLTPNQINALASQSSQQTPVGQQPQTQAQVLQKKPGTNKPYPWKASPSAADIQSGNLTIVKGMSGNSVTEIQNLLNTGGAKLNPDGKFGTRTYNALIAFQKKSGAKNQKGIVDADTYNKLKGGGQESIEIDNSSIDMGSSVGGDKGYDVADNTAGPSSNSLDML